MFECVNVFNLRAANEKLENPLKNRVLRAPSPLTGFAFQPAALAAPAGGPRGAGAVPGPGSRTERLPNARRGESARIATPFA